MCSLAQAEWQTAAPISPAAPSRRAGFVAFALGQRQIFGVWGGVGGWYLWGWAPWLALFASDLLEVRLDRERELVAGAVAAAIALNLIWFQVAYRVYG